MNFYKQNEKLIKKYFEISKDLEEIFEKDSTDFWIFNKIHDNFKNIKKLRKILKKIEENLDYYMSERYSQLDDEISQIKENVASQKIEFKQVDESETD